MLTSDLQRHVNKYYGKYSGSVVENDDPEKLGRLKVKVPSLFGQDLELWARPCLPPGHYFVPPLEAVVWIEFEAGDTRHPLWVGAWYKKDSLPDDAKDTPTTSGVIHTPAGHSVHLSDKDGKEQIVIKHKANVSITLSDKGVLIEDGGGNVVELQDGKVLVKAAEVKVESDKVALGKNAMDPTINGNMLKTLWALLQNHMHPSAMGPTGPPTPPIPALDSALTQAVTVK